MNYRKQFKSGETIIEVILYVLIVGVLLISYFSFFNNLFSFFNKKEAQREVFSESSFLISKIGFSIENAKSILSPLSGSSTMLSLESYNPGESPVNIYLQGADVHYLSSTTPDTILNSNRVQINTLSFTVLQNNSIPSSVQINLGMQFNNSSGKQEQNYSLNSTSTFTLKGK